MTYYQAAHGGRPACLRCGQHCNDAIDCDLALDGVPPEAWNRPRCTWCGGFCDSGGECDETRAALLAATGRP